MLFPTLDYLFFLGLTVFLYWGVPRPYRMLVLGLSSIGFYASWSIVYLPVMLLVVGIAWAGSLWIHAWRRYAGRGLRLAIVNGLLLLPLFFFKYWNWIGENAEAVAQIAGSVLDLPRVGLQHPLVGISFYTFHAIAYVIDVHRIPIEDDKDGPEPDLWKYATFQTFFPQLVAGPIVRKNELLPQLNNLPLLRQNDVAEGLWRIIKGMAKKLLIADVIAVGIVDPVFAEPGRFTAPEVMVALYAYTLQLYCDFGGYSDIAVGSARLFGITLPENFRRPYLATTVAGFWRRWHITLSDWVRDYIFYPLGGSRSPGWKTYRNTILTLIIIGVWHGASWNFVVYGLLHGIAVSVNRFLQRRHGRRPEDPLPNAGAWLWRWALTFHFVVLARILFRAPDLASSYEMLISLGDIQPAFPRFSPVVWATLLVGYALHFTPERWSITLGSLFTRQHPFVWALVAAGVGAMALLLGTGEQLAFVYYQF